MNKRIKELIEKTDAKELEHGLYGGVYIGAIKGEFLEEFAELIVKECVRECYKLSTSEPSLEYNQGRIDCANDIRAHFNIP